jgi:disulfide bond formation protein DsbB
MDSLPLDRARWPLLALIASAAMLATAHAFERLLYLAPCPLCYTQRQIYWAAAGVALVAVFLNWRGAPPQVKSAGCLLLGMVFLAGAGVSGYHSLVEWGILPPPASCAAGNVNVSGGDLWERLGKPVAVVSCDKALWRMPAEWGLSMAGWNFLVSIGLAVLSVVAAMRPMRTDTANEPVKS